MFRKSPSFYRTNIITRFPAPHYSETQGDRRIVSWRDLRAKELCARLSDEPASYVLIQRSRFALSLSLCLSPTLFLYLYILCPHYLQTVRCPVTYYVKFFLCYFVGLAALVFAPRHKAQNEINHKRHCGV